MLSTVTTSTPVNLRAVKRTLFMIALRRIVTTVTLSQFILHIARRIFDRECKTVSNK